MQWNTITHYENHGLKRAHLPKYYSEGTLAYLEHLQKSRQETKTTNGDDGSSYNKHISKQ